VHPRRVISVAGLLLAVAACSKSPDTPAGGTTQAGQPGAGRQGGRGGASITLAATDIAIVSPTMLEEATPVSGDLRPIETIQVRSRIEGNLTSVLVREGQQVRAGQLLAQFESADEESSRRSAEADLVAAQTELANAEWNRDQSRELFRAGAIAERDFKVTEQSVTLGQARVAAAEARLRSSSSVMRDTRVVAPGAGVVASRAVEAGERVARGAPMFTIVRTDMLEFAAAVPARMASFVRVGQTVHFAADGRTFSGTLARVSPTIDPASRSVTVYVQVPNPSGALKGGALATGRVVGRTIPGAIAVPLGAIRQTQNSSTPIVYRVADRTLEVVPVVLGTTDDRLGMVEVLEGLAAGDRIVIGNVGTLGRGMQVTIIGGEGGRGDGRSDGGRSAGGGAAGRAPAADSARTGARPTGARPTGARPTGAPPAGRGS
jgi:membrane fusion protein, multidrug efflux system